MLSRRPSRVCSVINSLRCGHCLGPEESDEKTTASTSLEQTNCQDIDFTDNIAALSAIVPMVSNV